MENLKSLTNELLVKNLKILTQKERELTSEILNYLKEVDSRKLYALRGYSSLFEFCIKELHYSEGSAARRISAMRLLKQVPQAQESLKSGEVNLSTLSQLQRFVKNQPDLSALQKYLSVDSVIAQKSVFTDTGKNTENTEKTNQTAILFESIKNKSQKQCEELFVKLSPQTENFQEKVRAVAEGITEIKFYVDNALMEKLEKLKSLLSHKNPYPNWQQLLEMLAEIALDRFDPEKKAQRVQEKVQTLTRQNPTQQMKQVSTQHDNAEKVKTLSTQHDNAGKVKLVRKVKPQQLNINRKIQTISQQRYIPAKLKSYIWMRDKGCCSYVDPLTGKACQSKHRLEIDHIKPIGIGGETKENNLRLLCQTHNQLMALKTFGSKYRSE